MTLSPELMNAILSMDSYNRGYRRSIELSQNKIGSYTITQDSLALGTTTIDQNIIRNDEAANFYAVAYDVNNDGKADVISYRGTDDPKGTNWANGDILTGWAVGAGNTEAKQAELAIKFYKTVAGASNYLAANIDLTGHSLGGGLAGLVGTIYKQDVYGYDAMPFLFAAENVKNELANGNASVRNLVYGTQAPWAVSTSYTTLANIIHGTYISGEALEFVRDLVSPIQSELQDENSLYSDGYLAEYGEYIPSLDRVDLHSQATLVIDMYGDTELGGVTDWHKSAPYFWSTLYDGAFAERIGMNNASVSGTLLSAAQAGNKDKFADILRMIIAYSAINEGEASARPFGDTGIVALYNDANDLGAALKHEKVAGNIKIYATDISKIFVDFAGTLALNKINQSGASDPVLPGVLSSAITGTLSIDLADSLWARAGGDQMPAMAGRGALYDMLFVTGSYGRKIEDLSLIRQTWNDFSADKIGRIVFKATDTDSTIDLKAFSASNKINVFVGSYGDDVVLGSAGSDLVYGSAGNDIFKAAGAKDFFDGGEDFDTFDLSAFSSGVRLSEGVYQGIYAAGGYTTLLAGYNRVENFILGAGNDEIKKSISYQTWNTIDAGSGFDTVGTGGYIEWYIESGKAISENNLVILNAERFTIESKATFYIKSLGHTYDMGMTTEQTLNYNVYNGRLNFNGQGALVTVTQIGNAAAGADTINVTNKNSLFVGSDKGDTFSGYFLGGIFLGKGNDIVANNVIVGDSTSPNGRKQILYYSGGNDVVQNNGDYVSLFISKNINPSLITSAEGNRKIVSTDGFTYHYTYDLTVNVAGYGSIVLKDRHRHVYSDNSIMGDSDDRWASGGGAPVYGYQYQAAPTAMAQFYDDILTDVVYGNSGNDIMYSVERGSLFGGPGNDIIYGSNALINNLDGGDGDDLIFGGNNNTTYYLSPETLYGGNGNDILHGEAGIDILYGGNGNDILIGGAAMDHLYGGAGSDIFYIVKGAGTDRIEDFEHGIDKIDLTAFDIGGFSDLRFSTGRPDFNISGQPAYIDGFYTRIYFGSGSDAENIIVRNSTQSDFTAADFILNGTKPFVDRPIAQNDNLVLVKDTQVAFNIMQLVSDSNGLGLQIDNISSSSNGVVTVGANGAVQYKPNAGFTGNDSIAYTVSNTAGLTSSGTITITIKASLNGTAQNDYLYGTIGNDIFYGGAGNDYMSGDDGNDTLYGESGMDNLFGDAGDDRLFGGDSDDTLTGGVGNDTLSGQSGNDVLFGDEGNDTLDGGAGIDSLYGGSGNDIYVFRINESQSSAPECIEEHLNGGTDTIKLTGGILPENTHMWLDDYGYLYIQYSSSDLIVSKGYRQEGNLLYTADQQIERIVFDNNTIWDLTQGYRLTYTDSSEAITASALADIIEARGGDDIVSAGTGNDRVFAGAGNDYIYAWDGNDELYGDAGNDYLYGEDGNDTLDGGVGKDVLLGGAGDDTYVFRIGDSLSANRDTIMDYAGEGNDTIRLVGGILPQNVTFTRNGESLVLKYSSIDEILLQGMKMNTAGTGWIVTTSQAERIVFDNGTIWNIADLYASTYKVTSGNDTVNASAAVSGVTIDLLAGNDNFIGSNFNDNVMGGNGNDIIEGRGGSDTLNGGAGTDTLTYASATAGITMDISKTTAQNTGGAGTDTVSAFENLTGSAYSDNLKGTSGANIISGGSGDDVIEGGAGNDTLKGEGGIDTLSYASATGAVTVNLSTTTAQAVGGGAGTDTITGFENIVGSNFNDTLRGTTGANTMTGGGGNDTIYGNSGNDILRGGAGADTLYGDAGNDTLWGEAGADNLYGGSGADIFKFDVTSLGSIDKIKDFKKTENDKLDLKDILIGYDPATKAITDYIQITTSGSNSILKIDRDGKGTTHAWTQVATIEAATGLTDELALKNSGTLIV